MEETAPSLDVPTVDTSTSQLGNSSGNKNPPPRPQKPPRPRFPPPPYIPPTCTPSSQEPSTTPTIPQNVIDKSVDTSTSPCPPTLPPPPLLLSPPPPPPPPSCLGSLQNETNIVSSGDTQQLPSPEGNDSVFIESPQDRPSRVQQMKAQLMKNQQEDKALKTENITIPKGASVSETDPSKSAELPVKVRELSQGKIARPFSSALEKALARPPTMGFRLPGFPVKPPTLSEEHPKESNHGELETVTLSEERVISFDSPPDKNFLSSVGMDRSKLKPSKTRGVKKVTVSTGEQNFQFGCDFVEKTEFQTEPSQVELKPPQVELNSSEDVVESRSKDETNDIEDFELLE